jgi:hypothetical protein
MSQHKTNTRVRTTPQVFTIPWVLYQVQHHPVRAVTAFLLPVLAVAALMVGVASQVGGYTKAIYDPNATVVIEVKPGNVEEVLSQDEITRRDVIAQLSNPGAVIVSEPASIFDTMQIASPIDIHTRMEQARKAQEESQKTETNTSPVVPGSQSVPDLVGGTIYFRHHLATDQDLRLSLTDGTSVRVVELVGTFPSLTDGHGNMHDRLWGITENGKVIFISLVQFTGHYDAQMQPVRPMGPVPYNRETTSSPLIASYNGTDITTISFVSRDTYVIQGTIYHNGPNYEVQWRHDAVKLEFR